MPQNFQNLKERRKTIHTDTAELKEDTPTESYTIYSIVNLENGKRYVGRSQHPKRRIKFHLCNLHTHNHPNPLINKDSNCEFGYEILEEGVPFEDRKEREKTWIFAFKTYDEKHGYNANDPCVKTEPELVRRVKPKYVNEVMVINVEKIKRMRLELGLTQQELAEMIGAKHKASISKIEKEERNCTLGMLNRLAKAFGCNPLSLILIKEE